MEDKSKIAINTILLLIVSVFIFGTLKYCREPLNRQNTDTIYINRDSIHQKIDSINCVVDSLISLKSKVVIKKGIKYINKLSHDTIEIIKRDSSLVLEIYKRDTIISISDSIIKNKDKQIASYIELDSLSNVRITQDRLRYVDLKNKYRNDIDSVVTKAKLNKFKSFGYGFATGFIVGFILPK